MDIKFGKEDGEGIEITFNEGRVFVKGLWKGRTSKSKKGAWNMSWHSEALFKQMCEKSLEILKKGKQEEKVEAKTDPDEVPF